MQSARSDFNIIDQDRRITFPVLQPSFLIQLCMLLFAKTEGKY